MSKKELVYLWINKTRYKCFENKEFNFNPYYDFHFDKNNALLIKEEIGHINIFNQNNILNISAVIGNNGAGKTTLLNFIQNIASYPLMSKYNNDDERYARFNNYETETKMYVCVFLVDGIIHVVNNTLNPIYFEGKEYPPFRDASGYSVKSCFEDFTRIIFSMSSSGKNYSHFKSEYESLFAINKGAIYKEEYEYNKRFSNQGFTSLYFINKIKEKFNFLDYLRFDCINSSIFSTSAYIKNINVYVSNFLGVLAIDYNDKESKANEDEKESRNFVLKEFNKIQDNHFTVDNYDFLIKLNFICEVLYVLNIDLGDDVLSWDSAYEKVRACIEKSKESHPIYDYFKNAIAEIDMFISAKHTNVNISYIDNYDDLAYSLCSIFEEKALAKLFKHIREHSSSFIAKYLYFDFNLSEGELVKIDMETFIFYISHVDEYSLNSGTKKSILHKNVILMLDECDISLHPNGKRQYLNNVVKYINENFADHNVQVILTTHSPIILSDLPSKNVLLLKKDDGDTEVLRGEERTFGANIFDLYNDSFFFSDGCTIGDFASNYISDLYENTKKELMNGNISEETKSKIELIGDSFLREQFYTFIKKDTNSVNSLINIIIQNIDDEKIKAELVDILDKLNDKAKSGK